MMKRNTENVEIDRDITWDIIGGILIALIVIGIVVELGYVPLWFFGILITIYQINLITKLILIMHNVKSHAYWRSTVGTITDIKIKNWSDLQYGSQFYNIRLRYLYTVNNTTYDGTKISVCFDRQLFSSLESVNTYIWNNHLTKGEHVTVYYDPANPMKAVLKRGACDEYFECKTDYLLRIGICCFLIVFCFAVWRI